MRRIRFLEEREGEREIIVKMKFSIFYRVFPFSAEIDSSRNHETEVVVKDGSRDRFVSS